MPRPLVIVDGSYLPEVRTAGAGLVLVDAGQLAATAAIWLGTRCAISSDAERAAIERGARWAPGVRVLTDSEASVPWACEVGIDRAAVIRHDVVTRPMTSASEHAPLA